MTIKRLNAVIEYDIHFVNYVANNRKKDWIDGSISNAKEKNAIIYHWIFFPNYNCRLDFLFTFWSSIFHIFEFLHLIVFFHSRFSHIFLWIFHFPLHHLHSLSYASVSISFIYYFFGFLSHLISSYPRFPRNAIDDGDFNAWYKNAAPTFALFYVEHADSPRVAKHTGPSEKRKHRRAAEDNCRRSPPSPGTAEIVDSPRHLPPLQLFSTPEMLCFSPSSMLTVFGGFPGNQENSHPRVVSKNFV